MKSVVYRYVGSREAGEAYAPCPPAFGPALTSHPLALVFSSHVSTRPPRFSDLATSLSIVFALSSIDKTMVTAAVLT